MAEIKLSQARALCSAAELQLVKASTKQSLKKMTEAELKKSIGQARKLRDKWRDVATQQRRDSQKKQNARTTNENARSAEKQELFGQVLARFEAQLAQVAGREPASRGKAAAKTPKKKRNQAHRLVRAATRDELEEKRSKLNAAAGVKKKAAKKKAAKKATAAPGVAVKKKAQATTAVAAPAKPKKKVAKKKSKSSAASAAIPVPALNDLSTSPAQQIQAEAATKRARLKASGLVSRVRGHVSSRGRKVQAKRDSR